jgi:aminoglycoside phosphotransferase (APT) family kinase protein
MTLDEFSPAESELKIDGDALARYLRGRLHGLGGELRVRQFRGGQSNPTYLLESGGRHWVLRKKPPGTLLRTAHMVDREYRVFSALADSAVPVPRPELFCADASVIGTEFFIMEYVSGRIFWNATLPEVGTASERRALYEEMNRVLSALHAVDPVLAGLSDYGRPGNYFERQIRRWSEQYRAAQTEPLSSMEWLMAWLPENVPAGDESRLVHGDFRLDNMIFHPHEPRVLAVLDWELSTLGHPLADVAYNCMPYHMAFRGAPALNEVAGEVSGIPTEGEYLRLYCDRTGRAGLPHWNFYLAFSFFRYASIVQGVYSRGLQGNASSAADAPAMRARAVEAAETGQRLAQSSASRA